MVEASTFVAFFLVFNGALLRVFAQQINKCSYNYKTFYYVRLSGPNPEGQGIMNFPPHIIALTHVVGSLDLGKEEVVGGRGERGL